MYKKKAPLLRRGFEGASPLHNWNLFGLVMLCALAAPAYAQERGSKYLTKDGCVLRARAYGDARIPRSDYGCTLQII